MLFDALLPRICKNLEVRKKVKLWLDDEALLRLDQPAYDKELAKKLTDNVYGMFSDHAVQRCGWEVDSAGVEGLIWIFELNGVLILGSNASRFIAMRPECCTNVQRFYCPRAAARPQGAEAIQDVSHNDSILNLKP